MIHLAPAIFALYPEAVRTAGEDAFDVDGNPVDYDRDAVEQLAEQMAQPLPLTPAEKLARAGLTVDELKELLGL